MALRFFRRHQKMVIIIMAALMVSFLVGFQGFQSFISRRPGDIVVGRTADGSKVTRNDLFLAEHDLEVLENLGFGAAFRDQDTGRTIPAWLTGEEYLALQGANAYSEPRTAFAYALLLEEARKARIEVTDDGVEAFLSQSGWTGQRYERLVSVLRRRLDLPEKDIRQTIQRWVMIHRSFVAAQVEVPPSETEMRKLYRDVTEGINLLVARIPAERFINDVAEPTEQQIREHFEQYRHVSSAAAYPTVRSFGFAYRQPNRVRITSLLVRQDVIERVTDVSSLEALKYYQEHAEDYQEEVPIPSTQPAGTTATQSGATAPSAPATGTAPSTTAPAQFRTVQKEYSEVKPQIMRMLKVRKVDGIVEDLLRRADRLINEFGEEPDAGQRQGDKTAFRDAYEYAKARMTLAADRGLARKVDANIDNEPLKAAIEKLELAAGVRICFPWGQHGEISLDPAVLVRLAEKDVSLGDALGRIAEQVKLPDLRWATCAGLEGAIFPVSGVELFPISLRRTGLMDWEALSKDEILGGSFTDLRRGQPLSVIAFSAQEFAGPEAERSGTMKAGQDGPSMYVAVGLRLKGRLLWRLAEAVPAHDPPSLTAELRKQVAMDLKTAAAFQVAVNRAENLKAAAMKARLDAIAKTADIETFETGLFARRDEGGLSEVPKLPPLPVGRENDHLRTYVLNSVFELAPENVEPPYPEEPAAVKALLLPAIREAVVVQRIGYEPPVRSEYEQARPLLQIRLLAMRQWAALQPWFGLRNIQQRLGYQPEGS